MAVGDAPFPPRNFEWTNGKEVRAWATNLAPDADVDRVTAMPLGVSAGPNRAWARTVRSQLADGADATFDQRDHLFLCNGYRNDSSRQAALDAVALAGFDNCDSTDRAGVVEYWRRLKSAKTTFCPRGFGTATFRATEALLAGSVPVMESYEKHDAVFSTLPVILTQKNFKQMDDPARLDQIWRDIVYKRNLFDMRPIFAPYWIAKLAEASHN